MNRSVWLAVAAVALCLFPAAAHAQFWTHQASTQTVSASTTPALNLGEELSLDKGPWVLGEILFVSSNSIVSNMTWRDQVHGSPGELYTKADVLSDADNLKNLGQFVSVTPGVYAIAGSPVPSEYYSIAASTNEVRLVFSIEEKAVATSTVAAASLPVPVSGMILTPTAYRGLGHFTSPGLSLDFNGTYYIGELYGKNDYANNPTHTDSLQQVGVWIITADGKMQVQSETKYRPAVAFGAEGSFLTRTAGQPTPNSSPTITATVSQNSTQFLTDAFVVASKKFGPVRTSIGYMQGDEGNFVSQLSSYLSPNAFIFYHSSPGQTVRSNGVPYVSAFGFPHPNMPIGVEVMQFNGAALHPVLFNFRIGAFLHLNFDIGYLKFDGGYSTLGLISFRWSQFPSQ